VGDRSRRICKIGSISISCPCALTEHHTMKAYWVSGGIAPRVLDLGTKCRWVASVTPRPRCPPGNSSWYPLDRKLDGPQSRSGRGGEEKNSQPLPGFEPPIIQPIAQRYTSDLSRLLKGKVVPVLFQPSTMQPRRTGGVEAQLQDVRLTNPVLRGQSSRCTCVINVTR
jgi:hypothetical protein